MERCTMICAVAMKMISSTSVMSTNGVTLIPKIGSPSSWGLLAMGVLLSPVHFFGFQHRDQLFSEAVRVDHRVLHTLLQEVIKRHAGKSHQNTDRCSDQRLRNPLHH